MSAISWDDVMICHPQLPCLAMTAFFLDYSQLEDETGTVIVPIGSAPSPVFFNI
jgi:hypothetical protein